MQAQFDAASQAADAGDCARAIGLFASLRASGKLKPGSIAEAAVMVREGRCMIATGDDAGGEATLLVGLPKLEAQPASFGEELAMTYDDLATAAIRRFDYLAAKTLLLKALPLSAANTRTEVLARLVRATAFDPGPEPLAYADEGIKLSAGHPNEKTMQATFLTLRARVLLNRGETQAAYAELKQALALTGGLGLRVSQLQVSMRGDLATAALLLGEKDEARNYLSYTGAGRIAESPFAGAQVMFAPDCGTATGLTPNDFAIVQFSIGDDGAVGFADTVYTRGGPQVAAAFGRAVAQWAWTPDRVKAIPAFYRSATRVELSCSNEGGGRIGPAGPLAMRFAEWAAPIAGVAAGDAYGDQATFAVLRRKLSASEITGDQRGILASAELLAIGPSTRPPEARTLGNLALAAMAKAGDVPAGVRNAVQVFEAGLPQDGAADDRREQPRDRDAMRRLLATPAIAGDPIAAATLRLSIAQGGRRDPAPADADALLQQVAQADGLPMRDPLRQYAQLTLANHAAARGDYAVAQDWFAKTGLTDEQCALIGMRPAMERTGAHSNDYPAAALAYGFEGFIKLEYDIGANGRAIAPRTIIAYPPFVFTDSAKRMAQGFRFETSYRPKSGVACSASSQTVNFEIPANH